MHIAWHWLWLEIEPLFKPSWREVTPLLTIQVGWNCTRTTTYLLHLHDLPDGYTSRHCLCSSHWELVYFLSLYYICTNICSAGWTRFPHSAENGSHCPKAETQGIFLDDDPQIHPRLNHLAELSALGLLHIPKSDPFLWFVTHQINNFRWKSSTVKTKHCCGTLWQ